MSERGHHLLMEEYRQVKKLKKEGFKYNEMIDKKHMVNSKTGERIKLIDVGRRAT